MPEEPPSQNLFAKFIFSIVSAVDGPITWVRETIVEPNQKVYPWYHQKFRRVPTVDECDVDDPVCFAEANLQYKRDRMVDEEIVSILRQRFEHCVIYERPDHVKKCKPLLDIYDEAATNWFIKYNLQKTESIRNLVDPVVNSKFSEFELNEKIGIDGDENVAKCKQLVYEYYLKSEDLEAKCKILHRNVQEVKDAWDKATNLKDSALKEREIMTLKYAKGEKQMLNEKELKEKAEHRCESLENEIKILNKKIQLQTEEKNRISTLYDNKLHELKYIKSENEGIMNQNTMLKNELKLCEIALKKQAELNDKGQITIENLKERIHIITGEKQIHEINEKKMTNLMNRIEEIELNKNEKEQLLKEQNKAYDELKEKYNSLLNENRIFIDKIQSLEMKKVEYESLLEHGVFNVNTSDELSEENLYERNNMSAELKRKLDLLELKNKELEINIESCRTREKDTLLFSQQLSESNAILQSENQNLNKLLNNFDAEKNDLKNLLSNCEQKYLSVLKQMNDEKEMSEHEKYNSLQQMETLKERLSEENTENVELKQQLLYQQEEISIIKKKHSRVLKELQKKILPCRDSHDDDDSCVSSMSLVSNMSKSTELSQEKIGVIQSDNVLNQNDLAARVLQLQEINVKKSEQIDFLEDKVKMLQMEHDEKTRLLHVYFSNEHSDAVTLNGMDIVKRSLRKLAVIMASLYRGRVSDDSLTFKLSLEINSKLQAVLEDMLLKNIILKQSLSILGEEVSKLKKKLDIINEEKFSEDNC